MMTAKTAEDKHQVRFNRHWEAYNSGECAAFPLDLAFRLTDGGKTIAESGDIEPERIPTAYVVDAEKWQEAMLSNAEHRASAELRAAKDAAKAAEKAKKLADEAAEKEQALKEQARLERDKKEQEAAKKPTLHDRYVDARRKKTRH